MRACRRTSVTAAGVGLGFAALATGTALAAGAGATVSLTDAGPNPASVTVAPGGKVTWKSTQGSHTVTDASPIKLFAGVTSFAYKNAGTYPYKVSGASKGGSVGVPVKLTPTSGTRSTFFNVRWSSTDPGPLDETIQYLAPGGKTWQSFTFKTTVHDATFIPSQWGNKTGTYSFRARLEKGSAATAWSPVATISVH